MSTNVLLRLGGGFGLGDTVQYSVVLKHLRKYRQDWSVRVAGHPPHVEALAGLCAGVMPLESKVPPDTDSEVSLSLHETFGEYDDSPCTKAVLCVRQTFRLPYDPELGRYECASAAAPGSALWAEIIDEAGGQKLVALHFRGNSHRANKELGSVGEGEIRNAVRRLGACPVGVWPGLAGGACGLASTISHCAAFVGIDSGPGKVASATETPTLIVWTRHHPLRYHDPAPNTTNLVPEDWGVMEPVRGNTERIRYFCKNYNYLTYGGDPVPAVAEWLKGVLS